MEPEPPATSPPRAGWGWPGLCFGLMAPVFAFALSRNLAAGHPGVELAPFAEKQVIAAALALPIFPALFVVALVVARRWRWAIGGALLGLLPLGALGSLALITVSSPHFIFAPVSVRFGVERAEYTVGVDGCGQRQTIVVVCPQDGSGCFAGGARQ